MSVQTVGYIERKSVWTTGVICRRMWTSARPPKYALMIAPTRWSGKPRWTSCHGLIPIVLQIGLAETGLAIQVVEAGIAEPEAREPARQDVEAFPCRLHVAQPVADIVRSQRAAMFVRLLLWRWNLQQLGQRRERVRLAGQRRRERLHVDEIAPVRSPLLIGFVGGVVFRVIVLILFRNRLSRGSVAREPDQRRPLREVLDGYGRPIFRQGEAETRPSCCAGRSHGGSPGARDRRED